MPDGNDSTALCVGDLLELLQSIDDPAAPIFVEVPEELYGTDAAEVFSVKIEAVHRALPDQPGTLRATFVTLVVGD